MSALRLALLAAALLGSSCLKAWDVGGPWACSDGGVCGDGFTCDDGVCCKPDGEPRCPTLPFEGTCPLGSSPATYYRDTDRDGAGDRATGRVFCRAPVKESWAALDTDCADGDPAIGPLATERCNAQDDDCDGELDDGLARQTWFRDVDGDGFGDDCATCRLEACAQPPGYAPRAGDCGPANPAVFPGAPESCNTTDDNCNGLVNDAPYTDVENPGSVGAAFDCATGQPGECAGGGLQCVFSASSSAFEKTCVPRSLPATDVCGNAKDEDCSGVADDRPGCGGPSSLLTQAGLRVRAVAFPFPDGGVPDGCLADRGGAEGMAWLNPSWIGNGASLHVLSVEAAPGTWWDLSTASSLRLPLFSRSFASASFTFGVWNQPGRESNPIVQLCGDTDAVFRRYEATATGPRLVNDGTTVFRIPLKPTAGSGWTATNPGFDFSRVRRLEILVTPETATNVTFTNRFPTDAGLVGFE